MSKLIKSSVWFFCSNFFLRLIGIITYPFIVRNLLKADISIFKSLQALLMIVVTIIPIGTNVLYISSGKERRKYYWDIIFLINLISLVIISAILYFYKPVSNDVLGIMFGKYKLYVILLISFIALVKSLSITKLSSIMEFKGISIALIFKQSILYSGIITICLTTKLLIHIILLLICVELIETLILLFYISKLNLNILPKKLLVFNKIDKRVMKYVSFIGLDQIFNQLAANFPLIFVVSLMGATIAPEFQLPFFAVMMPAQIIVTSISKVLFPYMSDYRENNQIQSTLLNLEFIVVFILLPVLLAFIIFSDVIVDILFDPSWYLSKFAFKIMPFLVLSNILNNPFTSIAAIKNKPYIQLVYSIVLFSSRIFSLMIGYKFGGFKLAVIMFVIGDIFIRTSRLVIDLNLISLKISKFITNFKSHLISTSLALITLLITKIFINNQYIEFSIFIIFYISSFILLEHKRLKQYYTKFVVAFGIK